MRYEFGFGVGFDRDHVRLNAGFVAKACKSILVRACELFGGCNLLQGQGAWIDDRGTLVLEESRVLVVDTTSTGRGSSEFSVADDAKVADLAEFIRAALHQEAVHVVKLVATAKNVTVRV
jgi:hypothetical protein